MKPVELLLFASLLELATLSLLELLTLLLLDLLIMLELEMIIELEPAFFHCWRGGKKSNQIKSKKKKINKPKNQEGKKISPDG